MHYRILKSMSRVLALSFVALVPIALSAQVAPSANGTPRNDSPSRWDIFMGYSYLSPHGKVNGITYNPIDYGAILSVTRYFNRNVGLQFEGDEHILLPESTYITTSQPGDD